MKKQLKEMAYLGSFYWVSNVLQKSLQFALIPLYTSYLTPKDYGTFGLIYVFVNWIERFISAPVGNGITRYYHAPEMQGKRKELLFSSYAFVMIQAGILTILFFITDGPLAGLIFGDPNLKRITRAFAFVLLMKPIGDLLHSLLRIQAKAKLLALISLCRFVLTALLQIYLLVWQNMGVMAMVYGAIFSAWFNVLVLCPYILRQIRFKFEWELLKPILHYGYPLIIAAIVGTTVRSADRFFLRIYSGLSLVGLYAFAYSFAGVIGIVLGTPLKQAFLPVVFKMEKEPEKVRKFVKLSCTYTYAIAIMLCLIVSVFAKDVIFLLAQNPKFYAAWTVVPLLAFAKGHQAVNGYFGNGMAMARKSILISLTSVMTLLVNLSLLLFLVPIIGLMGAGSAALATAVARNVIRGYYSHKVYNQQFELRRLLHINIIGVAVFILALGVMLTNLSLWIIIPLKLSIIAVYPVLLWVTRVFTKAERGQIITFVNRCRSQGFFGLVESVARIYKR